jgi:hypothetical protein
MLLIHRPKAVAIRILAPFLLAAGLSGSALGAWRSLAPGMDLAVFGGGEASGSDSAITIVRIDPARWDLELAGATLSGTPEGRTARQWCERQGFTAAINAGMFATDYSTHVGYLRFREHVNSDKINGYQSVAAFDPRTRGLPRFRIFDLDAPGITMAQILRDYASVAQNLRLIARPGRNRWGQKEREWSEAALGEDGTGRILFILCQTPFTMHDLNEKLLALDIGLVSAQHLEGGPEAQLYVKAGDLELEITGAQRTFSTGRDRSAVLPVPNVLGVRARAARNK